MLDKLHAKNHKCVGYRLDKEAYKLINTQSCESLFALFSTYKKNSLNMGFWSWMIYTMFIIEEMNCLNEKKLQKSGYNPQILKKQSNIIEEPLFKCLFPYDS